MTAGLAGLGTHIDFIINVAEDVFRFGKRAVFGELHGGRGFLLCRFVDFFQLGFVEDPLIFQAVFPQRDGVVVLLVELDLFRFAVFLRVSICY